jgi:hypothetical protein
MSASKIIRLAAVAVLLVAMRPAMAQDRTSVLTVNGRGALALSSSAAAGYQSYFEHSCPLVLAAHESGGRVTQTVGPDDNCLTGHVDFQRYIAATLARCEGGTRYGECWIVAIGREVVWEGPVRAAKGKWTPRTSRQFSVVLSGRVPNGSGGRMFEQTVGLLTWRKDDRTADLTFAPDSVYGTCTGALTLAKDAAEGTPSAFELTCSKMGKVAGAFDVGPDGRTGAGAGSGANARHFDLVVLPHPEAVAKK